MSDFVSDANVIPHSDVDIFRVLSDLRNLEHVKGYIPEERIKDFTFDRDSVSFVVDSIGRVTFSVQEREPNSLVKFKSERLPFDLILMMKLTPVSEKSTEMLLVVHSNLNPFMRSMVEKPLMDAMNRIADALSELPYDRI